MYQLMRAVGAALLLFVAFSSQATAQATCAADARCVDQPDLDKLLQLAREHQCRAQTRPKVTADDVTIVVDRQGRVYGSGTGTRPYTARFDWCNYQLTLRSELKLHAAKRIEPSWGLRLRVKASVGLLLRSVGEGKKWSESLDAGVAVEPFHYRFLNLDLVVAVRSLGLGLGVDVTDNFGVLIAGVVTYAGAVSPLLSLSFVF